MTLEYLDRLQKGWYPIDVMPKQLKSSDWVALMIDTHPEDYRAGQYLTARSAWFSIPGEHLDRDAAWDALEEMMETRH